MRILHPIQVVFEDKVTQKRYNDFGVVLKENFMFISNILTNIVVKSRSKLSLKVKLDILKTINLTKHNNTLIKILNLYCLELITKQFIHLKFLILNSIH